MSVQALLTTLLLPPLGLLLAAVLLALWASRGRRGAALVAALLVLAAMALSTPFAAGMLRVSLERVLPPPPPEEPEAIVVLSADVAHARSGLEVGPLTLERMRAGAELHRRTGLPLLVTGGVFIAGDGKPVPIARLMARSYAEEFGIAVRWIEPEARDTAENARFSAALLRADGIGRAFVVSHSWHLPRALAAFVREGFPAAPAPVRLGPVPDGRVSDWIPRPDHAFQSWLCLREWAGIVVYRLRDG